MDEVDREVLKEAVAQIRKIMSSSMPNNFYDAGTIIQPYFILLDAKRGQPKRRTGVDVNVIQRELELMMHRGEIEKDNSWLDPKAIAEKEARVKAIEDSYKDRRK